MKSSPKLIFTATLGPRRQGTRLSGVYLATLDEEPKISSLIEKQLEDPRGRGFTALTYDKDYFYLVWSEGGSNDDLLRIKWSDPTSIESIELPEFFDTTQIEVAKGAIWLLSGSALEVLNLNAKTLKENGRIVIERHTPENSIENPFLLEGRDHKGRIRATSLLLQDTGIEVGHFGISEGDFKSPQLTSLKFGLDAPASTIERKDLPVSGYYYPTFYRLYDTKELVISDSGRGVISVGKKSARLDGGWVRGLAASSESLFVGLSSFSFPDLDGGTRPSEKVLQILELERSSLSLKQRFVLNEIGQIHSIRLVSEPDLSILEAPVVDSETLFRVSTTAVGLRSPYLAISSEAKSSAPDLFKLNCPLTLLDLQDFILKTTIEGSFYGTQSGREVDRSTGLTRFYPTTKEDHLTTLFVDIPMNSRIKRFIRVVLDVSDRASARNLLVYLQDQDFRTLVPLEHSGFGKTSSESGSATVGFLSVGSMTIGSLFRFTDGLPAKVRLVISSLDGRPTILPQRIRVQI